MYAVFVRVLNLSLAASILILVIVLLRWLLRRAPRGSLPSPGSIEFCVETDYRITIYQQPHLAVVTFQDEVRYYRTHAGDYTSAVNLLQQET